MMSRRSISILSLSIILASCSQTPTQQDAKKVVKPIPQATAQPIVPPVAIQNIRRIPKEQYIPLSRPKVVSQSIIRRPQPRVVQRPRPVHRPRVAPKPRRIHRPKVVHRPRVVHRARPRPVYRPRIVQKPRVIRRPPPRRSAPRRPVPRKIVRAAPSRSLGSFSAGRLSGDFANNSRLLSFINRMSRRHGFNRSYLLGVFSQAKNRNWIASYWNRNKPSKGKRRRVGRTGGWNRYRAKFISASNVSKGVAFWKSNQATLQRASRRYRVDPAYIVAIMGVETRWGAILGKYRVIDALTTSALTNQRRSKFFFSELEKFLLMARNERMNPLQPKGSFAGAMGLGQFMPSSFHNYAVDFDRNGVRDLWNKTDAIGSVANYFSRHGWRNGEAIAIPARVTGKRYRTMPAGYKVKYSVGSLASKGIKAKYRSRHSGRVNYIRLNTYSGAEPWIGYHNFYVITRYNHSNYYAMAVHQLAQAIKARMGGRYMAKR